MEEKFRIEFNSFKRQHSGKDISQYWITSCRRKGLYDDSTHGAILYSPDNITDSAGAAPTTSKQQKEKSDSAGPKTKANRRRSRTKKRSVSPPPGDATSTRPATTGAEAQAPSNNNSELDDAALQVDQFGLAMDDSLDGGGLEEPGDGGGDMYDLSGLLDGADTSVGDLKPAAVGSASPPTDTSTSRQQSALATSDVLGVGIPPSHSKSILQKINLAFGIVEAVRAMDVFPESNGGSAACHNLDTLQSLGEQLYGHFCGFRPFSTANQMDSTTTTNSNDVATSDDDGDQRSKRGKVVESGSYIPLSDMGFPSSLSILVQQLCSINIDAGSTGLSGNIPYESVDDVLEELQLMSKDPDRYLFGGAAIGAPQTGTLHFEEGKLYGREEELSYVMNAFRNLKTNERREVLCITGDSGTGKSALAMQMQKPVEDMDGYFLAEKFDELQQVQQVPVVFSALNHFCAEVCRRGGSVLDNMRDRLREALGTDGNVLVGLIPNLSNIIEEYQGAADTSTLTAPELTGQAAFMLLLFCSRQLIRTISCPEHPAVLLLDDMQWADELSLQLLEAVTTDDEIKSFLVIACYRDGEVSVDHPLQQRLGAIHRAGTVLSEIHVDNIGKESVTRLVSDALRISPSQARPLADLVHSKTSGQPLFVIQFLKLLSDEGLLRFSLSSRQWQWDLNAISVKRVADNVAELMTAKMLRYPVEVLRSLKLAACLGHECDKTMLDLLGSGGGEGNNDSNNGNAYHKGGVSSIADHLDVAVADGLIIKSGTLTKAVYRFSHDQIQYAAYSLIAPDELIALHLQVARVLFEKASPEELDGMLFTVLDQYGRGSSLLVDRSEKTRVAQLYLSAAKRSLSTTFALLSASIFALQGILLLDEDHWLTDYDLALALYSTSAEAHNGCGVFDQVETCANIVFARACSFEDKLPAYFSLVQVTGTQGRLFDATNLGLDVLQKLGVLLAANPDVEAAMSAIDQTSEMLEAIPTETLIGKKMEDAKALAAMKMLHLLCRYTYMARQELMAVVMCRMVQMAIQHGICNESVVAFSCYGVLACNSGQLTLGHKY